MILEEVGNKKKVHLPYELKIYLGKVTEYAKYSLYNDNIIFDMKNRNISQSDLYEDNPGESINSSRTRKDSDRDREKLSLGLQAYLTNRNPNLYTETVYEMFKQRFEIDMNGISENALWLTAYAYEFFFITMVNVELMCGEENLSTPIRKINEITESFTRLKKGFELLFYPLVLAEGYNDFFDSAIGSYWLSPIKGSYYNFYNKIFVYNNVNVVKESITRFFRVRASEGFVNFEDIYNLKGNIKNAEDIYDNYPILANFFVKIFISDAHKILEKAAISKKKNDKYDFSKNDLNSSEKQGLLKFLLADFMPTVIKKIQFLLEQEKTSGGGFELYKKMMILAEGSPDFISNVELVKLDEFQPSGVERWDNFEASVESDAGLFFEWATKREDEGYFDIYSNSSLETVEDLLYHFNDTRTTKARKEMREQAIKTHEKLF